MSGITDNFSMDCPTCGPSTVHFVDGEMVPHGCDYVPPTLIIDAPVARAVVTCTCALAQFPNPQCPTHGRASDPLVRLFLAAQALVETGLTAAVADAVVDAVVACQDDVDHICRVTAKGWTVRHPVACRVESDLFDCLFNEALDNIGFWAKGLGTGDYRLGWDEDGHLSFDRVFH